MINPNKKLWRWGPIDGRPIYPDAWYDGMTKNMALFSPGWPDGYSLYKKDRYSYVCDLADLYARAEEIFGKYILNDAKLKSIYKHWRLVVRELSELNKKIKHTKLSLLTDYELYKLVDSWYKKYSYEFWGIGLLPEIANFGGESLIKKLINKFLPPADQVNAMEKLSAPEDYSFYALEELDLLKLKPLKGDNLDKALSRHQKKYFWILNSYHDTRVLSIKYFAGQLYKISSLQAKRRLKELNKQSLKVKADKKKIVRQYSLGKRALNLSRKLAYCIWWQDNRKSYIFQTNHVIDVFLKELSKRYGISAEDMHYYIFKDILSLLKTGKRLPASEIKQRKNYFVVIWQKRGGVKYISGPKAKAIYNRYQIKGNLLNKGLIVGEAVSAGITKGRVRVILSSKRANKLRVGEILVTTMTSPDFVVAIKKAGAIITDAGGITCHAAIVARELGIPCIVGTKIATKVLKDGDRVEVDATKGIVKKL